MIRSIFVAAVAALLLVVTPAFADNGNIHLGDLDISMPFARATLPNAPVAGGFMTITNHGAAADTLLSVTSSVAATAQVHEMKMDGDVMKMRALPDGLEIPAGGAVTLSPGGYHIMFMGLKQPFVEGTKVTITLTFKAAGAVDIDLPVLGAAAAAAMAH
ncbi:copper chaperone PCu(A)C [Devosia sp.]|uniref:copper chaperone PCu(A)C n=1 Tax=Devosia sp. TaxID=1871048 RepID=UPI003263B35D